MPNKDAEKRKQADKRYNEKRAGKRSRGWACVVYPESASPEWVEKLREGHIQTLISPLHDKDTTAEGEIKKAHYHVMAMFDNPVPDTAAAEYFARAGVKVPPEMLKSVKGYARYLAHMDDHDKHRYSENDVVALSGAVWAAVALDDGEADDVALDEIMDWLIETECVSFWDLCVYAKKVRPEWKRVTRHKTIYLTSLVKAYAWKREHSPAEVQEQGFDDWAEEHSGHDDGDENGQA